MQKLFNLMAEEHGVVLLESELQEIICVAVEANEEIKKEEANNHE